MIFLIICVVSVPGESPALSFVLSNPASWAVCCAGTRQKIVTATGISLFRASQQRTFLRYDLQNTTVASQRSMIYIFKAERVKSFARPPNWAETKLVGSPVPVSPSEGENHNLLALKGCRKRKWKRIILLFFRLETANIAPYKYRAVEKYLLPSPPLCNSTCFFPSLLCHSF